MKGVIAIILVQIAGGIFSILLTAAYQVFLFAIAYAVWWALLTISGVEGHIQIGTHAFSYPTALALLCLALRRISTTVTKSNKKS